MAVKILFEREERLFSECGATRANAPIQGQMKKKKKSLLNWRIERIHESSVSHLGSVNRTHAQNHGQVKKKTTPLLNWHHKWHGDATTSSNQVVTIDEGWKDHVDLTIKKFKMSSTTLPCKLMTSSKANMESSKVSLDKEQDDISLFIVHNYVDGEITHNAKEVEASLCSSTASCGRTFEDNCRENSPLLQAVDSKIPTEVRSYVSFDRKNENVNNSLLDDDISAISFEKILLSRHREGDHFLEDDVTLMATKAVGTGCVIPKQRMIENITSLKYAQRAARGCHTKFRDDDMTYVTVDVDEWEREFGHHGCCFAQQLHGIVMETGDAVYDVVGEPEDYPFGKLLVYAVMKCTKGKE